MISSTLDVNISYICNYLLIVEFLLQMWFICFAWVSDDSVFVLRSPDLQLYIPRSNSHLLGLKAESVPTLLVLSPIVLM